MSTCVELVDRVFEADAEGDLDLGCFAHAQEPMKALERLYVTTPGRG